MTTITATYEEYKWFIDDLIRHSFITKSQKQYLKIKKKTLGENEAIVKNFAEHYQFLIQDEIQSHHWNEEYCNLHPLVVYYLGPDGSLQHDSLRFTSDDNNHDTSFVCQVQTVLADYLKANDLNIKN